MTERLSKNKNLDFCPSCHCKVRHPFKGANVRGKVQIMCPCGNSRIIFAGHEKSLKDLFNFQSIKNLFKFRKHRTFKTDLADFKANLKKMFNQPKRAPRNFRAEFRAWRRRDHGVKTFFQKVKWHLFPLVFGYSIFGLSVMTANAQGLVNLKNIEVGDQVLSKTGDLNTVESIEKQEMRGSFYIVNGKLFIGSEQSVLLDQRAVHARLLKVGDVLTDKYGRDVKIETIEKVTGRYYFYRLEVDGDHTYYLDDLVMHNANRFLITGGAAKTWTNADTTIWAALSGGATGSSVPGSSDAVLMDGSSGAGSATLNYDPTIQSITMNAYTGTFDDGNRSPTMGNFANTGTSTRTLTMGSGIWTITGNNTTIWSMGTVTGLTLNKGTATVNFTYSGSVGTRTLSIGAPINDINISAGTDALSTVAAIMVNNVNLSGYTGTHSGAGLWTITGNLTLGTGMTSTATGQKSMTSSGSVTITSNSVAMDNPLNINGTGTFTLADKLVLGTTRNILITTGTFDANNKDVTIGIMTITGTNVRSLLMRSGIWDINGAGTIWNGSTTTNLTLNAGSSVIKISANTVSARTINTGSSTLNDVQVTNGGGDLIITSGTVVNNIDFTGFSGNYLSSNLSVGGNLTLGVSMSIITGANTITLTATSGTKILTFNGVVVNRNFLFNGAGGWQFADALNCSLNVSLTAGSLDFNGKTVTAAQFSSNGSSTRSLTCGTMTVNLSGTGTVWSATSSLTLSAGSATIKINNASASAKTFAGGNLTYGNLYFAVGAGSGLLSVTGNNTFVDIKDDGTVAHSMLFTGGGTTTFATWSINGTAGQLVTMGVISGTTNFNLIKTGGGVASFDYVSISRATVSPGGTFIAGSHCVNGGNNRSIAFRDSADFFL